MPPRPPFADHKIRLPPAAAAGQSTSARSLGTHVPGKELLHEAGPAAGVLETELAAAGILHDLRGHSGAKHAFFNDQWHAYQPAAAADSWQRVLASFAEHVRRGPP